MKKKNYISLASFLGNPSDDKLVLEKKEVFALIGTMFEGGQEFANTDMPHDEGVVAITEIIRRIFPVSLGDNCNYDTEVEHDDCDCFGCVSASFYKDGKESFEMGRKILNGMAEDKEEESEDDSEVEEIKRKLAKKLGDLGLDVELVGEGIAIKVQGGSSDVEKEAKKIKDVKNKVDEALREFKKELQKSKRK